MPSLCFYFQVHQPYRLKPYPFNKIGEDHFYLYDQLNEEVFDKVADRCYLPMNALLKQLARKHPGKLKISFSFSGIVLEQMEQLRPDVLESFQTLVHTGAVELMNETYYHSLAGLYEEGEFVYQVEQHQSKIKELFGQEPRVFRNTELILNDAVIEAVGKMGYEVLLAEAPSGFDQKASVNKVYEAAAADGLKLVLRDTPRSDDISFRFADPDWDGYPMSATDFARKLSKAEASDYFGLFMDYETFGEHRPASTGVFEFMEHLPEAAFEAGLDMAWPSELARLSSYGEMAYRDVVSWAGEAKDLSSWRENRLQVDALQQIYSYQGRLMELGNADLLRVWRCLQTSDHFYYMSTRYKDDPVHQVFSHYKTPFDAYINYKNVVSDFEQTLA